MAVEPRGPDILTRTSIPLSASAGGDHPLGSVPAPPESASNSPADQANGIPKEISPQEMGAAVAAKAGGPEPEVVAEPVVEATPKPALKADEVDVSDLDPKLPGYAVREITKHRKQAQQKAAAAEATAATAAAEATAARETAAALQTKLDEALAKLTPAEPVVEVKPDTRPTPDQFEDPDTYDTALAEWGVREGERKIEARLATEKQAAVDEAKRVSDAAAEEAATAARTAQETEANRLNEAFEVKKIAALEKYPDFDEVTMADDALHISPAMTHAMLLADNSADVAYYLAKNPDEANRILAHQNVAQQIGEMYLLANRLATPPARAPRARPIDPVSTGSAPAGGVRTLADVAAEDMGEYYAKRNPQLQQERKPFFPNGVLH